MYGRIVIVAAGLVSASVAVLVNLSPLPPEPTIKKADSIVSWVYDPETKVTNVARSGVIALGYKPTAIDYNAPLVPTKVRTIAVSPDPMSDLDANGDIVSEEEAASKKKLAQQK